MAGGCLVATWSSHSSHGCNLGPGVIARTSAQAAPWTTPTPRTDTKMCNSQVLSIDHQFLIVYDLTKDFDRFCSLLIFQNVAERFTSLDC